MMRLLLTHILCFPSTILQNNTAAAVLTAIAAIAGPTMAVGFTLPYWLRYAIIFIGISCSDEIFNIKNVHISLLATPRFLTGPGSRPCLRSSSSFSNSSMAFNPPLCQGSDRKFLKQCIKQQGFSVRPQFLTIVLPLVFVHSQ